MCDGHPAIGFGWTQDRYAASAIGIGIIANDSIEGVLYYDYPSGMSSETYVIAGVLELYEASSAHAFDVGAIVF